MSFFQPNLLGLVAPFAAGKSRGLKAVKQFLTDHDIPHEPNVISDGQSILNALAIDHEINLGRNHIHPPKDIDDEALLQMTEKNYREGHSHTSAKKDLGFAVTGYFVPGTMYLQFFDALSKPRDPNKIHLFELSGGVSGYPDDHPIALADYSFGRMIYEFGQGTYPLDWIQKMLGIIHPQVPGDFEGRVLLNNLRLEDVPTDEDIQTGDKSWGIPWAGMKLSWRDDFSTMEKFLAGYGLQNRIHHIANDGGPAYFQELDATLQTIFQPWLDEEGRFRDLNGPEANMDRGRRR